MNKHLFIETIKVKNGVFYNLSLHRARMQKTAMYYFNTCSELGLSREMIPSHLRQGLVKCRVLYASNIVSVEFERYSFKEIKSLTVVEDNDIEYPYKSADRTELNLLYQKKGEGSDVLIIRNGLVTDTSYTNLVFENSSGLFTPVSCLLKGVKRQQLLDEGIIVERNISLDDIASYSKIYLINAMMDLEDEICLSVSDLR